MHTEALKHTVTHAAHLIDLPGLFALLHAYFKGEGVMFVCADDNRPLSLCVSVNASIIV